MPYKDSGLAKEKAKERMRRHRDKLRPVTPDVTPFVTPSGVTPATPPSFEQELDSCRGRVKFLVEQLTLANQELIELKGENERLRVKVVSPVIDVKSVFSLPVYNWQTAKVGERYRKFMNGRWNEVVAREVDAEGNEVRE